MVPNKIRAYVRKSPKAWNVQHGMLKYDVHGSEIGDNNFFWET